MSFSPKIGDANVGEVQPRTRLAMKTMATTMATTMAIKAVKAMAMKDMKATKTMKAMYIKAVAIKAVATKAIKSRRKGLAAKLETVGMLTTPKPIDGAAAAMVQRQELGETLGFTALKLRSTEFNWARFVF